MRRLSRLSVMMLLFAVSVIAHREALAQDKASKIDELMTIYHNYGQFNGSVLVAEKGNVIFKKGFGLAEMEWNIPNAPDTKFRLGSITKQFTSMLTMQLVAEGKIKLDGKLSEYLPTYRKEIGDKVTIHQLLTHTSGIPSYTSLPKFFQDVSRNPYTVEDFVTKYCSGDLEFEPGSKFEYDNSGYFLLGAIIEKLTGKSYEQNLKERIFEPLGMKDTGYDHHDTLMPRRASGYEKTSTGYINAPYLDMSIPYAAGSLYSTVEDLFKWDQALYGEKLLAEKYKSTMFTPALQSYAYGWVINRMPVGDNKEMIHSVSHGGGINGFNTVIVRFIDDKNLIVLLNNTGGTRLDEMSSGIAAILYGKPYHLPRKSIREVLSKIVVEKDVSAAIKEYRDLKATKSDAYDFAEGELNQLGYQMMQMHRVKDAIEIFKLNVEQFPNSANVYDSLGEAYMNDGQKDLAIKNYKKSLELNPKNQNAADTLKKLESS